MPKSIIIIIATIAIIGCSKNLKDNSNVHKSSEQAPHIQSSIQDNVVEKSSHCGDASDNGLVTCLSQIQTSNPHQVKIKLSIKNESGPSKYFCIFQTPFENSRNLTGDSFKISDDQGDSVNYKGIMKKRSAPSHANGDYMKVSPGTTISAETDLTHQYAFKPGTFKITFDSYVSELPASNTITVTVK